MWFLQGKRSFAEKRKRKKAQSRGSRTLLTGTEEGAGSGFQCSNGLPSGRISLRKEPQESPIGNYKPTLSVLSKRISFSNREPTWSAKGELSEVTGPVSPWLIPPLLATEPTSPGGCLPAPHASHPSMSPQ